MLIDELPMPKNNLRLSEAIKNITPQEADIVVNEMIELYKKCDPQTQEEREFFFDELGKKIDNDLEEK